MDINEISVAAHNEKRSSRQKGNDDSPRRAGSRCSPISLSPSEQDSEECDQRGGTIERTTERRAASAASAQCGGESLRGKSVSCSLFFRSHPDPALPPAVILQIVLDADHVSSNGSFIWSTPMVMLVSTGRPQVGITPWGLIIC